MVDVKCQCPDCLHRDVCMVEQGYRAMQEQLKGLELPNILEITIRCKKFMDRGSGFTAIKGLKE